MNELALFAGAGGGILGGKLLGWRTVCAVEWDAYARDVLVARQNDGILDPFPIWDDVQTFDGRPWRGRVDVVSGGFPCQDISSAGKGEGIDGKRSSMWSHMARIIGEVRPQFVFVENSPLLVGRGLARVLGDFTEMGYDAEWGVLGAHHASAPHKRDRIWIVGYTDSHGESDGAVDAEMEIVPDVADANGRRCGEQGKREMELSRGTEVVRASETVAGSGSGRPGKGHSRAESCQDRAWWPEPDVGRVAHGVACGMDRLRAIGNGQVPRVAAMAWEILGEND